MKNEKEIKNAIKTLNEIIEKLNYNDHLLIIEKTRTAIEYLKWVLEEDLK